MISARPRHQFGRPTKHGIRWRDDMATANKDVTELMNSLIEVCREGEDRFSIAAERTKDPDIKSLLTRFSKQRKQFVADLQAEVHQLGGSPPAMMRSHRAWTAERDRGS